MVGWFFTSYHTDTITRPGVPRLTPILLDYSDRIQTDEGKIEWVPAGSGGNILARVRASAATLSTIAADADIQRIPTSRLDDPLSSLTTPQKTALRDKMLAIGYTTIEIQDALGSDLGAITLGQLLRFTAQRMKQWLYDPQFSTWGDSPGWLMNADTAVDDLDVAGG